MLLLNSQQQEALVKIDAFISSKKEKMHLLEGFAGTGKTTVITQLFSSRKFFKKDIVFAATTNKAVSVLQNMFGNKYEHVEFKTIHKLCKIKRRITDDGNIEFNLNESPEMFKKNKKTIFNYDIIIIDECSMISQKILALLVGYSSRIRGKIIFVGDRYQLPPVNENISEVFKLPISVSKLSKVVRCNDSVVEFGTRIRNSIDKGENISTKGCKSDKFKTFKNSSLWLQNFIDTFDRDRNNVLVAYTNSRCHEINHFIREKIYGENAKQEYLVDELIVFNSYYSEKTFELSALNINVQDDTYQVTPPEDTAQIDDEHENKAVFYTSHKARIKECKQIKLRLPSFPLQSLFNLSTKLDLKYKIHKPESFDPDSDCPICFEKIKDKESIETDCGHIFCEKCIKIWIEQNNQCPYCRMTIVEKENRVVFKDDPELGDLINTFQKITTDVDFKVWKIYVDSPSMAGTIYSPIKSEKGRFDTLITKLKETIHKIKKHIIVNAEKKKYSAKQVFVIQRLWEYFYYSYMDIFADISYGYCITVHKSQGSTFDDVFIDSKNIMSFKNKDTLNCLYTAVTRSSKAVKVLV
jgi:hypothetical protein